VSNRDIQLSIKHTTGLEELINKTVEQRTNCAACMIGKSILENYPGLKERADKHQTTQHLSKDTIIRQYSMIVIRVFNGSENQG
jgi:hypothetical protein